MMNQYAIEQDMDNLPVKTVIGTEDLREIVMKLNNKPFNENLTLVSFDEFSSLELLELLNKILIKLDNQNNVNIKEELQERTAGRITEFMKVLNYTSSYDMNWQQGLVQGDKRVIYPILYYLLTRYPSMEKRAYLAKYLVPFQIQEDLQQDKEINNQNQQYRDLQAEFQVIHQQLETAQKDAMNPNDLNKEIKQMEQEKEQLVQKINMFKNKNTNKPEFQALLEVTNMLRKEQEEEAKISEKIYTQRQQLEYSDQQLLQAQQRLMDARKSLQTDNSPEAMLDALKNDVKKERELCQDRLGYEIQEKIKKINATEQLLDEPSLTNDELMSLENSTLILQKTVTQLENKLNQQAKPADDKLAIYKQQAALVTKKKEKVLEELQRAMEENELLENRLKNKENEMQKLKGPGYKSKDEFDNYARNLREKTTKYKKMKDEIKEITAEKSILQRTQQILQNKQEELEINVRQNEKNKGILGFSETQQKMEKISEQKGNIDEMKEKTLEEISKIVTNIENQLKIKKNKLQPQIKELKDLRTKFEQLDIQYKSKKKDYEYITAGVQSENSALEAEVKALKDKVYQEDSKTSILRYQIEILNIKTKRLNDETSFKKSQAFIQQCISRGDSELKDLKQQRELVKENHEPSLRQMNLFKDLNQLLKIKLNVTNNEDAKWKQEEYGGNVNRLVLD